MKINLENTPQPNGSQFATPTPGPREMTPEEWLEYGDRVLAEQAPPRHQTTIQRQTPCGSILTLCAEHDAAIRAGTITPRDHTAPQFDLAGLLAYSLQSLSLPILPPSSYTSYSLATPPEPS